MEKQQGFSVVEGLLIVLVLAVIGFAGYYVWNQQQENKDADTSQQTTQQTNENTEPNKEADEPEVIVEEDFVLPKGWKTVTKNGLTVSYPKEWDDVEEDYMKLVVGGRQKDEIMYVGFGAPLGYKYLENGNWEYIYTYETDEKLEKREPKETAVQVKGSESTIIVSSGDGGCGGSRIGIAYDGDLYTFSLPWYCDEGHGVGEGDSGIPPQEVADNLDNVIKSISIE